MPIRALKTSAPKLYISENKKVINFVLHILISFSIPELRRFIYSWSAWLDQVNFGTQFQFRALNLSKDVPQNRRPPEKKTKPTQEKKS